ncbi:ATP-binding cassette domain-containing protein [Methanofollis formosanus]|nr:ATP-binding cassette domain-containing protein [Methanofollis formosanus]
MIEVSDLNKTYRRGLFGSTATPAVSDVSFKINRGECLGLIGESGSGKTTLGKLLLRLIEPDSGTATFEGTDLFALKNRDLRRLRLKMQMVFQDPTSSLNPCMTVESCIDEALKRRGVRDRKERERERLGLMEKVGLGPEFLRRYPYELSGGQTQRVVLARALAVKPSFIVADEPTSALDVSVQAQVLHLMKNLQAEYGITYLFISHDLDVVRYMCDRVAVMSGGRIVEIGETESVFNRPQHSFTASLIHQNSELDTFLKEKTDSISRTPSQDLISDQRQETESLTQ